MNPKTLYICYFGLRQPLVQTQVIPYLLEIAEDGIEVSLLTFEPDFKENWPAGEIESERKRMAEKGIDWHCLPYHKRFSVIATAYDVFRGAWHTRKLTQSKNFNVLHVRAHVPGPMAVLARKYSRHKPKILFDIRGFIPEEYADAGIWPKDGRLFRAVKRVERWLMKEADGFVVLTEKARSILFLESSPLIDGNQNQLNGLDKRGRPVEVIPCCVDLANRFADDQEKLRSTMRAALKLNGRLVITHLGALGGIYLTEELADFAAAAREENNTTFAMFLTQSDPGQIIPLLQARGFSDEDYVVKKIDVTEVPNYLCASDIALSFVRSGYSTISRSPTKIPEYLACGLPIVSNRGTGDVDDLIEGTGIGVLIDDFSKESYLKALTEIEILGDVREKNRNAALREFDLKNVGGKRYRRLYRELLEERV